MIIVIVGKDVEQQEVVGMQRVTTTLEANLAVSHKAKYTFNIQSSNHVPWYLTTWFHQPKCPLIDELINKLWYANAMECHSAIEIINYQATQTYMWTLNAYC